MKNILLSIVAVIALSTSSHADLKDDLTKMWDEFKEEREALKSKRERVQADRKKIYEEAEDKTKKLLKDIEDQVN